MSERTSDTGGSGGQAAEGGASHHQRLRDFLAAEGFRPWVEEEEDRPRTIYFKAEGRTFSVRASDADPDFVQVAYGYGLDEPWRDERLLLRTALRVQGEVKVVKVYLPPRLDFVEFQAELFLGGHPLGLDLLERCLAALRSTAKAFYDAVQPEVPRARA